MDEIPKVCYLYWENETMSFMRYMSIRSFKYYNPDFRVVLITKRNKTGQRSSIYKESQDISYFNGKCYWDKCLELDIEIQYLEDSYPEIDRLRLDTQYNSDVLAWYILGNHGGFIADTDIIFTNPVDYEKFKDIDVSIFAYDNNFAIGFLFGRPNQVYRDLYTISKQVKHNNYQSAGGFVFRNYFLVYGNMYPELNIKFIENELVYPFVHKMSWEDSLEYPWKYKKELNNNICGIHWYGGFPLSQEYNNILTENNYKNYNNTITYYINKVLTEQK